MESVGDGGRGEDTHGLPLAHPHRAAAGELRGGGEEREDQQAEQQLAGEPLDAGRAEEEDCEVVGQSHQPAAQEVVGSTALAGARPGHLPELQDQGAHQAQAGADQVRHCQAENQAGKLTVAESDSKCYDVSTWCPYYLVRLNRISGAAAMLTTKVMTSMTDRQRTAALLTSVPVISPAHPLPSETCAGLI